MNEHVLKIIEIMPGTNEIDAEEIEFIFASTLADLKDRCNVDKFTDKQMELIVYIVAGRLRIMALERKLEEEMTSTPSERLVTVGDTSIKETAGKTAVSKSSQLFAAKNSYEDMINSFVVNNRRIRW